MKKYPKNTALNARSRVMVSLLVSGAVGLLSVQAHAAPAQAAPQLAMTKSAAPTESLQTPKVQTFETALSLRGSGLDIEPAKAAPAEATSGSTTAVPPVAESASQDNRQPGDDYVWLLASDTRPWALGYAELVPLNSLYFTLPTEQEARIMLPGYVADAADRTRFVVTRYITDNIGSAAQARGRQLETFNLWADNTNKQKRLLPKDPWTAYQFNKEALAAVKVFKAKIQAQTEPTVLQMAKDINSSVEKISPVMAVMSTYEQQMTWYRVLVQLKEGIGLYQARAADADRQILDSISAFERDNPPVARPTSAPPQRPGPDGVRPVTAGVEPTSSAALTPEMRETAQAPVKKQEPASQSGGIFVLLGVGVLAIFFFMKLRKRVSKKGGTTPVNTD